jgi:hypothetical protein
MSKLTQLDIEDIKKFRAEGHTIAFLAWSYDASIKTIKKILKENDETK